MIETYDLACNGLLEQAFGNPLAQLATGLNQSTPQVSTSTLSAVSILVLEIKVTSTTLIAKGRNGIPTIYIGHSLGAMLAFYAADALKRIAQ